MPSVVSPDTILPLELTFIAFSTVQSVRSPVSKEKFSKAFIVLVQSTVASAEGSGALACSLQEASLKGHSRRLHKWQRGKYELFV